MSSFLRGENLIKSIRLFDFKKSQIPEPRKLKKKFIAQFWSTNNVNKAKIWLKKEFYLFQRIGTKYENITVYLENANSPHIRVLSLPGRGFWVNFRKKCGECGEFS